MYENELTEIINGCRVNNQKSQHELFALFYNYAMSIAHRYAGTLHEAEEIVNDSFVKVFINIERFEYRWTFKSWLRKIIINTAIDAFRAKQIRPKTSDLENFFDLGFEIDIIESLTREEMLRHVALLPPAYRTVFNMFVVDEYSHEEIAEILGISIGSSKSNLSKARQKLKKLIQSDITERNRI
ncbi:MAG: RNA polymerase sigma factor [Saprospiraceae bacterium]|nr:RNA polymerase sigma factor [Saprospiraceae bacterium]